MDVRSVDISNTETARIELERAVQRREYGAETLDPIKGRLLTSIPRDDLLALATIVSGGVKISQGDYRSFLVYEKGLMFSEDPEEYESTHDEPNNYNHLLNAYNAVWNELVNQAKNPDEL